MRDKNYTPWQHFKNNYIFTSIAFVVMFVLSLTMSLFRYDDLWWLSFIFLFIGVVAVPIGSYLSWKGIFK